ncbi:histidine phosphatase family protein [Streptomyces sp. NPDC059396]|uniref:histidine phosphatase family protein n=1 Tax=Streptomyces sp. NPDC059396 TaxID=3346819 RepID=UPI00369CD69E
MTTRVMFISPAISTALREARFATTEPTEAVEPDIATSGTVTDTSGTATATDALDPPDALDPLGLRQAEAVRETFPRTATATLYVSPSARCRRTAEVLGLDAAPLPDLAPCAMGRWQGRTLDEVTAAEPESVAAWLSDPAAAPHGGESLRTFHTRVAHWLDTLGSESAGSRHVIAVAEPDIIRAAAVHALGAGPRSFWRIDIQPLSAVELSGRGGRWNLLGGRPLHTTAP